MAAKIIWDRRRSPTRYVSDHFGVKLWQLRAAIHRIKDHGNVAPDERVIIFDDGSVTDENGDPIGNIYDEV